MTSQAGKALVTFNAIVLRSGNQLMPTKSSIKIVNRAKQEVCLCSCGEISHAVQVTMRRSLSGATWVIMTQSVVAHAGLECAPSVRALRSHDFLLRFQVHPRRFLFLRGRLDICCFPMTRVVWAD